MHDTTRCIDKLELYRVDKKTGEWIKEIETNNKPSLWQRIKLKLGLYKCANDAYTNYMVNQLAVFTAGKLLYAGVGTSGASGTDYTLNELVSPVLTRVAPTSITYTNVYGSDDDLPDSVQYVIVMTADAAYTLREAALYTASTSGYMGSRQVFSDWSIASGDEFVMVWTTTYGRG